MRPPVAGGGFEGAGAGPVPPQLLGGMVPTPSLVFGTWHSLPELPGQSPFLLPALGWGAEEEEQPSSSSTGLGQGLARVPVILQL